MRIDAFAGALRQNAIVHDQDLFAAPEVIATGRQTLAPSRRALLIELVRTGTLDWSPDVVEAVYGGLNAGAQHAFSVYRGDPGGWPDETDYVRAARADIVDAGQAPKLVTDIAATQRATGNPFGLDDGAGEASSGATVLFVDAATRAIAPEIGDAARRLVRRACPGAGELSMGTGGYELVDLGLWDDAATAMRVTIDRLTALGARTVVSESPEAVVALARLAPVVGVAHDLDILHLTTWLARHGDAIATATAPLARVATWHDSARLGRSLGEYDAPRHLLGGIPGLELREMRYIRDQAIPTGPALGFPWPGTVPAMGRRRLREAVATGADLVVAGSAYSKRNLLAAGATGAPEIRDIAEVLVMGMDD